LFKYLKKGEDCYVQEQFNSYFRETLDREIKLAFDQGGRVAFMIMDVDDFKSYNDSLGHPVGDDLLKRLARLLGKNIRGSDILGRYGGTSLP
jgi:diguanylate cyclase (GGDEF)-like protein